MQRRCGTFANSYHCHESTTHQRQNGGPRGPPGARTTSLLGGAVTARAEVEGDSSSHVAACDIDGRRGYIVQDAVASFLEKSDELL